MYQITMLYSLNIQPLQSSWASLVAQMVKNPSIMWETWVRSLGWKDPLEEGTATHSRILDWRISMDKGAWWTTVHGLQRIGHNWATKCACAHIHLNYVQILLINYTSIKLGEKKDCWLRPHTKTVITVPLCTILRSHEIFFLSSQEINPEQIY